MLSLRWWKALVTLTCPLKTCPSLFCQNCPAAKSLFSFLNNDTPLLDSEAAPRYLCIEWLSPSNPRAPLAPTSSRRSCSDLLGILSKTICDRPWENQQSISPLEPEEECGRGPGTHKLFVTSGTHVSPWLPSPLAGLSDRTEWHAQLGCIGSARTEKAFISRKRHCASLQTEVISFPFLYFLTSQIYTFYSVCQRSPEESNSQVKNLKKYLCSVPRSVKNNYHSFKIST